ncbi:MAG: hypothetical protein ACWA41_01950 [Putridiphycobacter sp.]
MKKLLFLLALITISNFAFSQCLSTSFESGYPTGWTQNSTYVNTGSANTGTGKLGMNSSGDWVVTDAIVDPCELTFYVRTSSDPDNWVLDIQTSTSTAGPWTTQGTVTENGAGGLVTNTYTQITVPINLTGTYYIRFILSSRSAGSCYIDDISLTCGCVSCTGPVAEPTNEATALATSNISCTTADLSWTLGADATNSLVVISTSAITGAPVDGTNYTANAVYGSGDILNAGEFIIYNGTGNTVSITGLTAGTNYFITIFEYNGTVTNCEENYLTGGASTSFTTLTGCVSNDPYITSILYNSCNGTSEGVDEIVTFETGTDPLAFDDITIYYPSQTYCNTCSGVSGTIDGGNLNNPTYVNDLNTLAGCTVFAFADPIPPNSTVMVFTGNPPTTVLDYSSQCGASNLPVYVIFNDNSSTIGRFSNTAVRTLTIDFGNGVSQSVTYDGGAQSNTDGATAQFDASGNPSYFISPNCVYPLPITLGDFYLKTFSDYTSIYWTTLSETNCDYFEVQKSTDGVNFISIGEVTGAGNSSTLINYSFRDESQNTGTVYYRLKQVDFDGKFQYSYTISTSSDLSSIYYAQNQIYLNLDEAKPNHNYVVNIYNLNGQLITSSFTNGKNALSFNQKGLFFVEIPELQIHKKVVCY